MTPGCLAIKVTKKEGEALATPSFCIQENAPYVPVRGSLKMPISGVSKVNTTKSRASPASAVIGSLADLQRSVSALKSRVS